MSTKATKSSTKTYNSRGSNIRYYEINDEFSHRMAQVIGLLRKHSLNLGWFDGKLPIKLHNLYFSIHDGEWRPGIPPTIWEDIAALLRTLDPKFEWKAAFQPMQSALIDDKLDSILGHIVQLEVQINKLSIAAGLKDTVPACIRMLKIEQCAGKCTIAPYKVRTLLMTGSVDAALLREKVMQALLKTYPDTVWKFEDEANLPGINWDEASQIDIVL